MSTSTFRNLNNLFNVLYLFYDIFLNIKMSQNKITIIFTMTVPVSASATDSLKRKLESETSQNDDDQVW